MQLELIPPTTEKPYTYYPNFLTQEESDRLLQHSLRAEWQQNEIRMFGKPIKVPRLEVMYGDRGCSYLYSGSVLLEPKPWTKELQWLRHRIERTVNYQFNVCIGNCYRDAQDSIGWHNDSEPSMGVNPGIASISLGAVRRFSVRQPHQAISHFDLAHGSLFWMHPGCQHSYVHQVPKSSKPVDLRINWTFRPHVNGTKS